MRRWLTLLALASFTMLRAATTSDDALDVEIVRTSDWETGFCTNIRIHNRSDREIEWSVDFDAEGVIDNMWSCNYSQDGNTLVTHISGLDWNRVVAPDASVEVGYCATKVASEEEEPQSSDEGNTEEEGGTEATDDEAAENDAGDGETAEEALVVTQVRKSEWDGGYCNDVVVSNPTDSDRIWNISTEVEGNIYTIWNVEYTFDENSKILTARGVDWNAVVGAHGEVTFGFCANLESDAAESQNDTSTEETEENADTTGDSGDGTADGTSGGDEVAFDASTTEVNTTTKTGDFGVEDYEEVLHKSYLFYEAQRASGPFPHIDWRNPAALDDGKDVGRDLTKGWFDAGDHVKFNLPMSYTVSALELGMLTFPDAYIRTGEMENAKDQVRYVLDYLMEAYEEGDPAIPSDDRVHYQVGDGHADHAFWGPPEDMTMERPTYTCDSEHRCSEVAGEMAAALAAGSILFEEEEVYSADLLAKAKGLFEYASTYEGNNGYTAASSFYASYSGYYDELAWAAAWLYRATGEEGYLTAARDYIEKKKDDVRWAMSWDNVTVLAAYVLYDLTGDPTCAEILRANTDDAMNRERTDGGLTFYLDWGSLRYAANSAFVSLLYAGTLPDGERRDALIEYAKSQIDYILGDNPRHSSYVVGFGNDYPINPHHRAAHYSLEHNIDTPVNNTYLLIGALVGGPKSKDDFDYVDDRHDYKANEVATDYNAGLTGALAGLIEMSSGE
ncbi:glycoside hydrolase family 9 protein [Hydrogenimonas sp.]